MAVVSLKQRALIAAMALGLCAPTLSRGLAQQYGAPEEKPSFGKSVSSGFKRGTKQISNLFKPRKKPPTSENDPLSLSTKVRSKANTYAAVARLYEQSGRLSEAVDSYQKALDDNPNNLAAMLGLARVKSRLDKHEEALALYLRALKAHPDNASVYNNMGAYYGSRGMFAEAVKALEQAVRLQPRQANYRANVAVVLVHLHRFDEAFNHLRAVNDEAVSYYNMGFLLKGEGELQAAGHHFQMALKANPAMRHARYWLSRVEGQLAQNAPPVNRPVERSPSRRVEPGPTFQQPKVGPRLGSRPTPPFQEPQASQPQASQPQGRATIQDSASPSTARQLPPPPSGRSMRRDNMLRGTMSPDTMPGRSSISDSSSDEPPEAPLPKRLPPIMELPDPPEDTLDGPELPRVPAPRRNISVRAVPMGR